MIPIWFGFVSPFKERDVQLQTFHLSCSDAICFLLSAERNWKVTTVSPPPSLPHQVTVFDSRQPYPISPGKTLFWTSSVFSAILWSHLSSCLQLHDLIHLCYRTGKAPAFLLAQLCPLLAALVVFHSCLPQIPNGYLQVLAKASAAYLTYSLLMSSISLSFKMSQ